MKERMTIQKRSSLFWARVTKGQINECWPWTGWINRHGYGGTTYRGKAMNASRLAWLLTHGDPENLSVLHRCDNRICCNPHHLFLGTQGDNVRDCRAKGRSRGHFSNPDHPRHTAKLTPAQVKEIREKWNRREATQTALGLSYGVHSSVISRLVRGENWSHIK